MSDVLNGLLEQDGYREDKEIIREQNGFDPMTGEPVYSYHAANGFDGMTGEPLYVNVEQAGYDTMTGQPVFKIKSEPPFPRTSGGVTRVSLAEPDNSNRKVIVIAAIAAVAVAAIIAAGFLSGLFLSSRDKVAKAAYKTIEDSTFGKMMIDAASLLSSSELTTSANADVSVYGYSGSAEATIAQNSRKGELYINAGADISDMFEQHANFYYDDSSIQLSLPDINDEVYVYRYTADNSGAIADLIREASDGSIEDLNTVLKSANDIFKSNDAYKRNLKKELRKAYKKVKVSGISSEQFEVDGKSRKCKGYRMHVSEENIAEFARALTKASKDAYGNEMEQMMSALAALTGEDDFLEMYDKAEDGEELAEMISDGAESFDIDFFLYGGKLAAIRASDDYDELIIEFHGGDRRCSNMDLTTKRKSSDRSETISIESSISGGKEKGKLYYNDTNVGSYDYDMKSGDFHAEVLNVGNTKGVLLVDKNNLRFETDITGSVSADIVLNIQNKARFAELDGDRVDVGAMTESEMEDTFMRLERQLENAAGGLEYLF